MSLSAGSFIAYDSTPFGSMSVIRLSTRSAICGAWPARANVLRTSPARCGSRVDEVERLAVEAGLVRDVVHRRGDPVDRHDVGPADLEADRAGTTRGSAWRAFWSALKK